MRAVVQRVSQASVRVGEEVSGGIEKGLLVYLGVGKEDSEADADWIVDKVLGLRIFQDGEGKMNLSVEETGGSLLLVSQFTLFADARKGRRPSYDQAAPTELAKALYDYALAEAGKRIAVQAGIFQASMRVAYINEGPVTILLDSKKAF